MPPVQQILRYDKLTPVVTPLNPLEDLTGWVRGLRSEGYTEDVLAEVHGITRQDNLRRSTQMICAHADRAVSLLEQAFSGPPNSSFLPIYYALLDLAKIYIVAAGRRTDLQKTKNRYHGVSYAPGNPNGLLTDTITLHPNGVVPLFHEVVTRESWKLQQRGDKQTMRLRKYYPYLRCVSHEYERIVGQRSNLVPCEVNLVQDEGDFRVTCHLRRKPGVTRRRLRFLKGMERHSERNFTTRNVDSMREAWESLVSARRRYLLYTDYIPGSGADTRIPISNQRFRLPEEFPLLLTFFHLGSVVRYDPELMRRFEESKEWGLLLSLRKHGTLRFLTLFWSFLHQEQYLIESG